MKVWKKLSAVALALVMVMALSVMASAASNETLTNGVAKDTTENTYNYKAIGNTLEIPKSITVTGTAPKVYGPTVTYSYDIVGVDITSGAPTVSDGISTTARPVKSGVTGGVTLSTVVFTSSEVALTNDTGSVTEKLTATVDLTKFSYPGIYRYAITEATTNTAALYTAGVTRPTEDAFFLDVYIKNDTNGTNNLSVYGYVLLDTNTNITSTDDPSHKVSALTTDSYATMDISVTKSVTGNMGDKTNQFPFTIAVNNNPISGTNMSYYSGKTNANTTAVTDASLTTSLKDGEVYVIKGLNPKATVTFTETNNTPDEYTVSVKDKADSLFVTAAAVTAGSNKATSALAVSNYDTVNATAVTTVPTASDYSAITFINNLDAISPTGVALRYAPYLAMLGAGVVALPLSLRKKEELY